MILFALLWVITHLNVVSRGLFTMVICEIALLSDKTPVYNQPVSMLTMSLKIVGLIGFGYLGVLLASLLYCLFLSIAFVEFARLNPYIVIIGGAILSGTLIGIGLKRNWI